MTEDRSIQAWGWVKPKDGEVVPDYPPVPIRIVREPDLTAPFIAVKRGTEPWAVGDEVEIHPVPTREEWRP